MRGFFFSFLFLPYSVLALPLEDVLRTTSANSPILKAARENITVADETKQQALADFLPQVEATARYTANRTSFSDDTPASNSTPNDVSLNVTQNIFNGRLFPALSAADKLEAQSVAQVADTTQNTLLTAVQNYTAVLVAEEIAKQQANLVESLGQQKKAAEVRFKYGDATKTDIALAEARLAAAAAQLLSANNTTRNARQTLAVSMGQTVAVADELLWPILVSDTAVTVEDVMDIHPQGRAAQLEVELQAANVKAAQGDFLPELTASASVTRNAGLTFFPDNTASEVGVNLSVPLFQGGRNVSAYRQAVAERTAAEETARQTRLELEQNLHTSQADLTLAKAEVAAFTAEVAATELAAYGTTREAELGERSTLDVLDAQQEVLDANVRLVQARARVVNFTYGVLAAQGRLSR